jgi:hypothetical protein
MSTVTRSEKQAHETARRLAAEALDRRLSFAEGTWLAEHLRSCAGCRAVAGEYGAIHDELRAMPRPEPPRDLWARTSAGLDEVDRARTRRSGAPRAIRLGRLGWASSLVSVLAVAIVLAAAGISAITPGKPAPTSPSASRTSQIAAATSPVVTSQDAVSVVGGTSYWLSPDNGVYQIKGGSAGCSGNAPSCTLTSSQSSVLGSVSSTSSVSVVISPSASQAAVWNGDKVVVMPLSSEQPASVSIDLLTPAPAAASGTPRPTPPATPAETPTPEASPGATESAAPAITPASTPAPGSTGPTDILEGYAVVGRSPQFSPDGKWLAFSARAVGRNSGSDVFVWRTGWPGARQVSSTNVDLFAGWLGERILVSDFTPGSASGSTGAANVTARSYIYDPVADSVRRIPRSMLLPVVDPTGRYVVYWAGTVALDPTSGLWMAERGDLYFDLWDDVLAYDRPPGQTGAGDAAFAQSLIAAPGSKGSPSSAADASPSAIVSPDASPSSSVEISPSPEPSPSGEPSVTQPPAPPTPEPSPSSEATSTDRLPQRLQVGKLGAVSSWVVRWDETGRFVAIWVGDGSSANAGKVKLLSVLPGRDLLDSGNPLLSVTARSNIVFDGRQFVYTSPGAGGNDRTYLIKLPEPPAVETPSPTPGATTKPNPTASPTESAIPSEAAPSSSLAPSARS